MPGVHVVTDSACDLTDDLAAAAGITVVPLTIRFGDDELLDRQDLSPAQFWERCKNSAALPQTSAPAPGAFARAYEDAATAGADAVVCLTLSSGVSATYQSALAGSEGLGDRVNVRVIDTRSLTMGQGLLCLSAAEAAVVKGQSNTVVGQALETCIATSSTEVTGKRPDPNYGFGRINVLSAVNAKSCR